MHKENPLVSVCFTCYNRKQYVAEAFQSVLQQTYSPLEIVVSDNCSTDGTREIVEKMISDYRSSGGKHRIVFSSNSYNVGHTVNIQICFRKATGALVVSAHDDDISCINRVSRIVEEWIKGDCKATVIHSAYDEIDVYGKFIRHVPSKSVASPLGANVAYAKRVIDFFDPIPCYIFAEDYVWAWRARILGPEIKIDDTLLKYRMGSGISTGDYLRHQRIEDRLHFLRVSAACHILRHDFKVVACRQPPSSSMPGLNVVVSMVEQTYSYFTHMWRIYADKSLKYRWVGLKRKRRMGGFKNRLEYYFQGVTFLEPWYLGALQRRVYNFFKIHIGGDKQCQ